jgi:hypothetical protein
MYWGVPLEDAYVVEIAAGGRDYCNPDMLVERWRTLGEGQEFDDPKDALRTAYAVRAAWRGAEDNLGVHIEVGGTCGDTMPFTEHPTDEQLNCWARMTYDQIPRCSRCGDALPDDYFFLIDRQDEGKFCSEHCADIAAEAMYAEEDEEA